MENIEKKDFWDKTGDFLWDIGVNTGYSFLDLTPLIIKNKNHRILFIVSSFTGIIPIIKFNIEPKFWALCSINYFLFSGTFRTFAQSKHCNLNRRLNEKFKKKVSVINSLDKERFINRINEITSGLKSNVDIIKSSEYKNKFEFIKIVLGTFRKNNIFQTSIRPIKNYVLRSSIPLETLIREKSELGRLFDTNIISINQQDKAKNILVVRTSKENIKNTEKMPVKIQYYLNELGFSVTKVVEDIKDSMKIYNIKTTSEFEKINKKCNHLAFRLGIDKNKLYMKEKKGTIQLIINGKSRTYYFVDYIGLESVKEKTKNMKIPIAVGIDLESGEIVCVDMAEFPHALVMGGTGGGKSNFINILIQSAMYLRSNIAFLMFDFKKVELAQYKNFKNVHFVNNYPDAIKAIDVLNEEMNRRLDLFTEAGVKDIEAYNFNLKYEKLPYTVAVIDEAADINLEADDKQTAEQVNKSLNQCINKARCTGIIIIYALQRADSTQIKVAIRDQLMTKVGFRTSSESQKQFIEINNLSKLTKGELILKYEEKEKLIKCFFIDEKKPSTNKVYNILKKLNSNAINLEKTKEYIENV